EEAEERGGWRRAVTDRKPIPSKPRVEVEPKPSTGDVEAWGQGLAERLTSVLETRQVPPEQLENVKKIQKLLLSNAAVLYASRRAQIEGQVATCETWPVLSKTSDTPPEEPPKDDVSSLKTPLEKRLNTLSEQQAVSATELQKVQAALKIAKTPEGLGKIGEFLDKFEDRNNQTQEAAQEVRNALSDLDGYFPD